MKSILKSIANNMASNRQISRRNTLIQKLMRHEAQIGGELFGKVPAGHRREFFCLDRHTWVWYEEYKDQQGQLRTITTRYEVRPGGVLKSQNGSHYMAVSDQEARNLLKAARKYVARVNNEVYSFV